MKINRVAYKIFLGILALSGMILIIMSLLVKTSYTSSLKKNEINFHIRSTNKTKDLFDFIMNLIDNTAKTIGSRDEVIDALKSASRPPEGQADFTMNEYLKELQGIQPFLGNITIAGTEGQCYSSNLTLKRAEIEDLYQHYACLFEAGTKRDYFVDAHNVDPLNYRDVLTGVWPIFDTQTQELLGQIYVGLNYSIFQEMFILSPITNNERILIIDSTGKIVFNYPAYISFESIVSEYPQLVTSTEVIIEGKVLGTDSIIVSETSGILGWKFIRIIDAKYVMSDTRKMQRYFNIVFIISIITSLIFSFYLSLLLTKPVKQLFDACKRIEKGDMSSRVSIQSGDEIGQLGHTFNLIMDQINHNFERELIEQKRRNELKLEILRAQINPHFLYNTLGSIKFIATLQEVHNVASMCSSLINLLKYNLSSSTLATLEEEVESIRNYVDLQKYRYGDIFEFKTDIQKNTKPCTISRFVLQPLVENCLIHGFDDTENGGEILIRSYFADESLYLEVIDNGGGIEPDMVEKINRDAKQDNHYNKIGISNIRERIQLQFGDRATLCYTSTVNSGTTARLKFPICVSSVEKEIVK
jgi:two-component system sensor histidine kinase YesM